MSAATAPAALVIGAGPAGLMAAEVLSAAGLPLTVAEQMPTAGRKFLMAGRSGLNLTMDTDAAAFAAVLDPVPALQAAIAAFGPAEVMAWARGLGQEVFTGSAGRVFPEAMKASPLLRAWLARLERRGVALRTRWRWTGWDGGAARFDTPQGPRAVPADLTVLACGGASWRRLGSDGAWTAHAGPVAPFAPANVGLTVEWSAHMARHFGRPVKGCALAAGPIATRGEFVISARGLEGSGIYTVSRAVRDGAPLTVDLCPDRPEADIRARLAAAKPGDSLSNRLRKALRLDPARLALLQEFGRPFPADLAPLLKALPIRHAGTRPLDEAISTAGGLRFDALDGLMLRDRLGVFAAGEMLDWEAPTGGYLITACLATGRAAALQALDHAGVPAPDLAAAPVARA